MNYNFNNAHTASYHYIFQKLDKSPFLRTFEAVLSFYLLLNNLIPLAFAIVTEVTKLVLMHFIEFDADFTNPETGAQCKCLIFLLHEDLAYVKHLFSDKTGTLTANKLTFRGCTIAG